MVTNCELGNSKVAQNACPQLSSVSKDPGNAMKGLHSVNILKHLRDFVQSDWFLPV